MEQGIVKKIIIYVFKVNRSSMGLKQCVNDNRIVI